MNKSEELKQALELIKEYDMIIYEGFGEETLRAVQLVCETAKEAEFLRQGWDKEIEYSKKLKDAATYLNNKRFERNEIDGSLEWDFLYCGIFDCLWDALYNLDTPTNDDK